MLLEPRASLINIPAHANNVAITQWNGSWISAGTIMPFSRHQAKGQPNAIRVANFIKADGDAIKTDVPD